MNIQTDALVGNQCKVESTDEFSFQGNRITYLNTKERGVGRNRNLLIEHASADICIFADDDMRFVDGYPQIAKTAFEQCPKADILVFNLIEKNPRRYINQKITRIHGYNYAKYGAARIALRREPLQKAGIRFRLSFGGGTKYGSGEDTIFLVEHANSAVLRSIRIHLVSASVHRTVIHKNEFPIRNLLHQHGVNTRFQIFPRIICRNNNAELHVYSSVSFLYARPPASIFFAACLRDTVSPNFFR